MSIVEGDRMHSTFWLPSNNQDNIGVIGLSIDGAGRDLVVDLSYEFTNLNGCNENAKNSLADGF